MTDVKILIPYAMKSEKEWLQKWIEVRVIFALIRSR
jgi:hypothetical protein